MLYGSANRDEEIFGPTARSSTSPEIPTRTSHSAAASIPASVRNWPDSRPVCCSRCCWAATRSSSWSATSTGCGPPWCPASSGCPCDSERGAEPCTWTSHPSRKQLRAEIRASLEAVMTPERIAAVAGRMEGGDAVKECVRALGAANLLGVGWPKEYGGRGFTALEQFIFFEEAQRVNAPIPLVTLNTVGPTLMQLRHRGAEAEVSARDPERHRRVRDRLLRTVGGKRSGVAAHHRGARRRRLRHQRPEDVHQRRGVRRLHLAGGAHRSGSQEAQGHHDLHRADVVAGLLLEAAAHHARGVHVLHLLRRRPGARERDRRAARTRAGG